MNMAEKQTKSSATKKKAPAKSKASKKQEDTVLVELNDALSQEKDKYLRLFAEFENFKKRTTKERIELFKTAGQEVISSLLPILDDLERAISQFEKQGTLEEIQGFVLINNKLNGILKSSGLEISTVNIGDVFDAEIHEAITQIPAPEEAQKGKIIDVVEKGYQLGEKIIRYPKIVVGK
jgi:molecular chaperone GrpE|tara:strand:- start:1195 stop:1731 length:537 start_codon:yes stop_codon:yes gene_type:complete